MIISEATKVFIATQPVDMRKQHNGLSALVFRYFPEALASGHYFVFYNRRRNRLKILFYHQGGLVLYYKRLEKGQFILPHFHSPAHSAQIPSSQLHLILNGLDSRQLPPRPLWKPRKKVKSGMDR